jgi:hypothetical protein
MRDRHADGALDPTTLTSSMTSMISSRVAPAERVAKCAQAGLVECVAATSKACRSSP